jgi:hypothetical protein
MSVGGKRFEISPELYAALLDEHEEDLVEAAYTDIDERKNDVGD